MRIECTRMEKKNDQRRRGKQTRVDRNSHFSRWTRRRRKNQQTITVQDTSSTLESVSGSFILLIRDPDFLFHKTQFGVFNRLTGYYQIVSTNSTTGTGKIESGYQEPFCTIQIRINKNTERDQRTFHCLFPETKGESKKILLRPHFHVYFQFPKHFLR